MTVESVSVVSQLAPALGLGATLAAAALVPSFTLGMALAPLADVLVIVSLMTVARVAAGLGALDSGAALPGLAAQTASATAVLAETALMLAVVTLALIGGSFNLDLIVRPAARGAFAASRRLGHCPGRHDGAGLRRGQCHAGGLIRCSAAPTLPCHG